MSQVVRIQSLKTSSTLVILPWISTTGHLSTCSAVSGCPHGQFGLFASPMRCRKLMKRPWPDLRRFNFTHWALFKSQPGGFVETTGMNSLSWESERFQLSCHAFRAHVSADNVEACCWLCSLIRWRRGFHGDSLLRSLFWISVIRRVLSMCFWEVLTLLNSCSECFCLLTAGGRTSESIGSCS